MTIDPDLRSGHYYVSVVNGEQYRLLLGPFTAHADALAQVEAVRRVARELDSQACWYGFGTCRIALESVTQPPTGILNARMLGGGWT